MKQDVSDEILGAYVDNELACSEKRTVAEEIKSDSEMETRAQSFLDLKTSIKDAYSDTDRHSRHSKRPGMPPKTTKRIFKQSIAASFILACGLIAGTMINTSNNSLNNAASTHSDNTLYGIKIQPVSQQENKVLLHIASADLKKLDFLLTKTERLLSDARNSQNPINIDIIANSSGIDLLRKTTTPYAQRIQNLQSKYSNLQFIACKKTLQRLQKDGQSIEMIKGVNAELPALDTIINRMEKGWTYIKI